MPPAALSSIILTDGTTTVTLSDTTKYGLLAGGWSPQIATRRAGVLGGRPYTQVVEEMRFDVYGTTTADAIANLAAVLRLIDQAHRWSLGESFSPVVLKYQPQGSTLTNPVQSLVYGFADNDPPATLPATYNDFLMVYEISDVTLRFVRDGAWLGDEETITDLTSAHPEIGTGTFTGFASHLSPVKLEIGSLPSDVSIGDYIPGFVLIADRASRIEIVEAEGMANGGVFTSDADAARKPSGTGVLVYTPSSTGEAESDPELISLDAGKRVGIIAAVRNDHATTSFAVRASIAGNNDRNLSSTRPVVIEPGSTDPQFVMLGVALCEEEYSLLYLHVQASAVAGTLSIDYLALVNLDNPTSRIVSIGTTDTGAGITDAFSEFTIDPRALEDVTPRVRLFGDTTPGDYAVPESWRGDAYLLSLGTTIAAIYVGAFTPGGYWRLWNDAGGGTSYAPSYTFTRRIAYLAPT
jgi:hypothetical protein